MKRMKKIKRHLKKWLGYLPGTRPSRFRYQKRIIRELQGRMNQLFKLKSLDSKTKKDIHPLVRYHEKKLALVQVFRNSFEKRFDILMMLLLIFWFPILTELSFLTDSQCMFFFQDSQWLQWLELEFSHSSFLLYYAILWIISTTIPLLILLILILTARGTGGRHSFLKFDGLFLFLVAVISTAAVIIFNNVIKKPWPLIEFDFILVSSIIAFFYVLGILFVFGSIFTLFDIYFERRCNKFYPESVIVHRLLKIISVAENNSALWLDIDLRKKLINHLEYIATVLQYHFPRVLPGGDMNTSLWLKEMSVQMATAFRELKKWILTPMPNTQESFIKKITNSLINAASCNWDKLERVEKPKTEKTTIRSLIFNYLKVLVTAGLPVILLWLFQKKIQTFAGQASHYVTIGVYLWAIINIILVFDPLLNLKISLFKNVSSILPFSKESQKGDKL